MMRLAISSLLSVLAVAIPVSANDWGAGVSYTYDGSGNIRQIGTDLQVYDTAGRLVRSDTNGVRTSFEYDAFGNRTRCQRPLTDCQPFTVTAAKNQIQGATYNGAGNVTQFEGHTYTYDAVNMPTRDVVNGSGVAVEYVYTADDERIAIYTASTGNWRWTLRDASGKVLRELASRNPASGTIGTSSWSWIKDYVYRDGLLLASRQIEPGQTTATTYRYHLDHLGTPRRITDASNQIVGQHSYHAFGPETSDGQNEPSLTPLKYTGHERDGDLDYMHARYYDPDMGRFLSVDPTWESADLRRPQSWNRYSYVMNNPVNMTDPDGKWWWTVTPMIDTSADTHHPETQELRKDILKATAFAVLVIATGGEILDSEPANPVDGEIVIDGNKYPEAARHIDDAQAAGHPSVITVDRQGATERRKEATRGTPTVPGADRDEYPPAVAREGGRGSSVRHIPPGDNRGAGGSMGQQLKKFKDDAKVVIKTIWNAIF